MDVGKAKGMAKQLVDLTETDAKQILHEMAEIVRHKKSGALGKTTTVPSCPGIYLIYHDSAPPREIAYIGETGNLAKRHGDLRRTENHTFRRSVGNDMLKTLHGFSPIHDTKSKFAPEIEKQLDRIIDGFHTVFVPLWIGRKEIEETIVESEKRKSRKTTFYNRKARR